MEKERLRDNIRNFSIIAHIDHGKSTLADKFLELTSSVPSRDMKEQVLDDMDLERERGITIKSHAIVIDYEYKDGEEYRLNLIDTPGHVDFKYEVSRSLAACEGVLLLVDGAQGVEAQTVSNLYMSLENDLEIIPAVSKIDLSAAEPEFVEEELVELLGMSQDEIIRTSAKEGIGVEKVLDAIVERIPPPMYKKGKPLKALVFDSIYNDYRGVIVYIRVFSGSISKGDKIKFFSTGKEFTVDDVGYLSFKPHPTDELVAGEVGYMVANIKDISEVSVGDTVTKAKKSAQEALPGYKDIQPMVYSGIYPTEDEDFESLKKGIEKLKLNDASLTFIPEKSAALGLGFRCGFLGRLHLEIVQERLEREQDLNIIATVPNVEYKIVTTDGEENFIENPSQLPEKNKIESFYEPYVEAEIDTRPDSIGNIMQLIMDRRGDYENTEYLGPQRVRIHFEAPLSEIIFNFFNKLKSLSQGFASLDYEVFDYREEELEKLDILINKKQVDALSMIVHSDKAYERARQVCKKLKEVIDRQLFEVRIQASNGSRIVASESIPPIKKDVTAKCYGGDVTRKRKLLERQKEGKKRMKQVGNVEIPQEAFFSVLDIEED